MRDHLALALLSSGAWPFFAELPFFRFPGLRRLLAIDLADLHLIAVLDRIRGIDDHPVGRLHAGADLDLAAGVEQDGHLLQHDLVVIDHRHLRRLVAEDHRARRHHQLVGIERQLELRLGIGAGRQQTVGIGKDRLDRQGAGGLRDRVRRGLELALEALLVVLGQLERDRHALLHVRRVDLRHSHVDAHLLGRGDLEQRLGAGVGRRDQRADVDVALRDRAVERGDDLLEALHRLHPVEVGLRRRDLGLAGTGVAGLLVGRSAATPPERRAAPSIDRR